MMRQPTFLASEKRFSFYKPLLLPLPINPGKDKIHEYFRNLFISYLYLPLLLQMLNMENRINFALKCEIFWSPVLKQDPPPHTHTSG